MDHLTTAKPLDDLEPDDPSSVGPYHLLGRIGAGGMGVVYLAQATDGARVAVKVIRPQLARETAFRDRFRREVAAARRVQSPVTAAVRDADPEASLPWVAFEFVDGPNLEEVIESALPRLSAAVGILGGVAEALIAIHEVGIIHRDLKPSNVLCPPNGVKVIDFGIAAALDATALTSANVLMGTPAWLSPEQILGQPLTTAVDVFAWGCIAVYTSTGRLAFGGAEDTAGVMMYRVVNVAPDLSDVPSALIDPVTAALSKRPEDRPTVPELLGMLLPGRRIETRLAPPLAPVPPPDPLATVIEPARESAWAGVGAAPIQSRRRRGAMYAVLGAGALVLAAALVVFVLTSGSGGPSASTGTTPATSGTTTPSVPATTTGVDNRLAQATALANLLSQDSTARNEVAAATQKVGNCSEDPAQGVNQLKDAIAIRNSVRGQLGGLPVDALGSGRQMVSQLDAALQASVTADQDYIGWMTDIGSQGCPVPTGSNAGFQGAVTASRQATTAKQAFVQLWNPVAAAFGLKQYAEPDL